MDQTQALEHYMWKPAGASLGLLGAMMLRMLQALTATLLLSNLAGFLPAQTFYGSILGTVTDQSDAALVGATVIVTNNGTGERRQVATSADGGFRFVNLVPGNYRLELELSGFRRYRRDNITVEVESAVRVDVAMQLGDVSQAVEVTSEAPLLTTENASLSQVVSARNVQEMPLNGRNVLNLVALVPGVVPQGNSEGNLTGKNVFAAGNYQIGGGTANQSATYFDGVPVNINYGNLVALVPNQDAVSEFRVQTNNNSAEYGRYTGGVINLASKGGTNEFHGSAYEFIRNRSLNAGTFFANRTGAGKPAFTQNQFGAAIGGPVQKDKTFFYFTYEGFRQRQGALFLYTVPTPEMRAGNFSDYRNASGAVVPIYDALTNCGTGSNAACVAGQAAQRLPFAGNIIPATRIDPVSRKFVDFPNWGQPNVPGQAFTRNFNFSKNATAGGDNDQINVRGDRNISDRQRLFGRFTRWNSSNQPVDVYGNGLRAGDPYSPEIFVTTQAVAADTYSFSPTAILDVRVSYMRWNYARLPGTLGIELSKTLGLPTYFDQLPALNGVDPVTTLPRIAATGYDTVGTGRLLGVTNNYVLSPTFTKIKGRHTFKFGAELRRLDINYYQNNTTGGTFNFDNVMSAQSSGGGASGNSFASFLLGYSSGGTVQTSPFTAGSMRYQGYFVNDTFQMTQKLTLTLGLRWEIPGVYTERFDRLVTFDPGLINPALPGNQVRGAYVLVNSPNHPERGLRPEHYNLFAPRIGVAYRLTQKTVIRTGIGLFFIPADVNFPEGPYGNVVNYVNNVMVNSIDNQITPLNTMKDPFPGGFLPPPGRNPTFQQLLLGGNNRSPLRNVNYGYTGQWNFGVQHQFAHELAMEVDYAGLRGVHLPLGNRQLNALDPQFFSQGNSLRDQVTNPFFGQVSNGPLSQRTVQRGQLLLPFPQYQANPDPGGYIGNSNYHSLQMKAEKRFKSGGTVLAAYTFSKVISDVETLTSWLDSANGVGGVQNWYDLRSERAISSFDSHRRLTVSYVVDLPVGKNQHFLSNVSGVTDRLLSGWGINGVSTFQDGFPLALTATPNLTGFNTGLRPNVVPGCEQEIAGSAQSRINKWFNTSCFAVPGIYTFGNLSRNHPNLRGHGINNFDFALFKKTQIKERFKLEFRTEFFNLFNRVQFGKPNQAASTAANNTFGVVTSQANNPRLVQFALRLIY